MRFHPRVTLLAMVTCAGCAGSSRSASLPGPEQDAALDLGASFLRAVVDSQKPTAFSELVLLAERASVEPARSAPIRHHPPAWLRATTSRLHLQGSCPPPEPACFQDRPGYLLAVGTPVRGSRDTVLLQVSLAGYRPDPRRLLPPGLGVSPPAGRPVTPASWAFATDWTLALVADSLGHLQTVRAGPATASDAF